MDMKLEVVVVPVSDVDRARAGAEVSEVFHDVGGEQVVPCPGA